MEENMEQQGLQGKKKLALIIAAGITALIVLVYLGLCIYVGASSAVLPGVRAAQVDLGGLTQDEAAHAMDQWLEHGYSGVRYELQCGDSTALLEGDLARLDSAAVAADAYMVGRTEPFLKRGAVILFHLAGGTTEVACPVQLSDAGVQQMAQALEQLRQKENVALVETVWSVSGDKLTIVRGVTGVQVDENGANEALLAAIQQPGHHTVEAPVVRTEPMPLDLKQVHSQIYAQAADAYVERDEQGAVQVVPHVVGIEFDPEQAQTQFEALAEGETGHIALTVTRPELSGEKLQRMLFSNILGECTTNIGGTEYRLNNVKVAAKAMDGTILMPGDVFSYNETLGPRTEANGYLPAPAYIGGKTVDDVGGGICQNSSTLYLAVLRANLEIVERTNHMYTVGYVPDGLDATVAYNAIDFKFRNNTNYPILVDAKVVERKMIVKLCGTDTQNVTVKMETETLSTTPYKVTYKPDASIGVGKTKVDTTAYTGRKVQVFRCVYDSQGNLISRTRESMNNYRHRDKVILYNPADAAQLGLVDANGTVHNTVQPKPEPAPQPEVPAAAPQPEPVPEQPEQPQTEQQPAPTEGGAAETGVPEQAGDAENLGV